MAESTNEFLSVERVRGLLHPPHKCHLLVHLEQAILRHLQVQTGGVGFVAAEGVFMELDRERLGVRGILVQLC